MNILAFRPLYTRALSVTYARLWGIRLWYLTIWGALLCLVPSGRLSFCVDLPYWHTIRTKEQKPRLLGCSDLYTALASSVSRDSLEIWRELGHTSDDRAIVLMYGQLMKHTSYVKITKSSTKFSQLVLCCSSGFYDGQNSLDFTNNNKLLPTFLKSGWQIIFVCKVKDPGKWQ